MKIAIVVGVFVLVACLCLQANADLERALQTPGPDGKTVPCKKLPAGLTKMCVKYSCNDATESVSVLGCALAQIKCEEGQVAEEVPEDVTKIYPDCCPYSRCRDA